MTDTDKDDILEPEAVDDDQTTAEDLGDSPEIDDVADAVAEAAVEESQASTPGKRRFGEWSGVDRLVATVLAGNLVLIAVLIFIPTGEKPAPQVPPRSGPPPTTQNPPPKTQPPSRKGRTPLFPRHELFEKAHAAAAAGQLSTAIAHLEKLLDEEPALGEIGRRVIYSDLAYYCELNGERDKAREFWKRARSTREVGLIPDELWRLAEEATDLDDHADARRYYARFLLQEGQLSEDQAQNLPLAFLRLADGYRDQAQAPTKESKEKER